MRNSNDSILTEESNINEGDRVRVYIPHPDDNPEVRPYQRDIPARYVAFRDHLRYNRRRGTVVRVRDSTTFTVEFDDPDETLDTNPPSIGFLPSDLVPLDDYGNDETGMMPVGDLVDTHYSAVENADRIVREARDALRYSARTANGAPLLTQSVALEIHIRISDERDLYVHGFDPRERLENEEIVRNADDILRRKATQLVRDHDDHDLRKSTAVMVAEELKSRTSDFTNTTGKNEGDE